MGFMVVLKCIFWEWFRFDFIECLMLNMCYYYWLVKNMLIFKLEYIFIGKDVIYWMILYFFVYFLFKIIMDKYGILLNFEIIFVLFVYGICK